MNCMGGLLRTLHQRPIAYYPVYADLTGHVADGVYLSQVLFYYGAHGQGFYKTDAELRQETRLSEWEFKEAKRRLKQLPFLTITSRGAPPCTYYEVDEEQLAAALKSYSDANLEETSKLNGRYPPTHLGGNRQIDDSPPLDSPPVSGEISEEQDPPLKCSPQGEPVRAAPRKKGHDPALEEVSRSVLAYLNRISGHHYGETDPEPALIHIKARLQHNATHTDCMLVIDWYQAVRLAEWPGAAQYFDFETLFRPKNFAKYLGRARAWEETGRPPPLDADGFPVGLVGRVTKTTARNMQVIAAAIRRREAHHGHE